MKLEKRRAKRRLGKDVEAQTLIAVLTYPTRLEQAKALGISESQLYNRILQFNLREKIEAQNKQYLESASAKLFKLLPKAVNGLDKNLDSEDERIVLDTSKEVLRRTMGDTKQNNLPLIQNNIQILNEKKEKYDL